MNRVTGTMLAAAVVAGAACQDRGSRVAETASADSAAVADTAPAVNPDELQVVNVMIGKRIGAGNLITEPTFQFAPGDTVYVSIGTEGTPDSATLAAAWVAQGGKTLDSTARSIQPEGRQNTEFHLSQPKGWAAGTYKVTIYADGDSVDAKTFAVKK